MSENISYGMSLFDKITSYIGVKAITSGFFSLIAFFFDSVRHEAIVAIVILVAFDFLTGITAAKIAKEEIKSAKVFRSAMKLVAYLMLVSAGHFAEVAFPIIASFADETVLAFLAVTELISTIENAGKMGFVVPKKLLNRLEKYRDNF